MTEFKKLKDILHLQLEPNCDALFGYADRLGAGSGDDASSATGLIDDQHALLMTTQTIACDAAARFLKLSLKAKETNPDKQIFNEKTSANILDEYAQFVALMARLYEVVVPAPDADEAGGHEGDADDTDNANVNKNTINDKTPAAVGAAGSPSPTLTPQSIMAERLDAVDTPVAAAFAAWDFGPQLQGIELAFAKALIERAQRAESQQTLMDSLQAVVAAEEKARQLIVMTEKSIFHTELVPGAAASRKEARARQHAREEQLYQDEISRRKVELAAFKERVAAPSALGGALAAVKALLSPQGFKIFRRTLLDLVDEVINRPENDNVRMVRTDHYRTVASFGHPGIVECRAVYAHMEVILGCIGYTIAYTKQTAHSARTPQHVAELGGGLELPMEGSGTMVRPIHYEAVGYEPYSERLLVFVEPDPSVDASAWCDWHEQASNTTAAIREALA